MDPDDQRLYAEYIKQQDQEMRMKRIRMQNNNQVSLWDQDNDIDLMIELEFVKLYHKEFHTILRPHVLLWTPLKKY
jgi:hypothetical protein